ncbi:hypothetical protein D3C87_1312120 [compost metagenome]
MARSLRNASDSKGVLPREINAMLAFFRRIGRIPLISEMVRSDTAGICSSYCRVHERTRRIVIFIKEIFNSSEIYLG